MTSFHKPADRFHAETSPMRWTSNQTTCWTEDSRLLAWFVKQSCACVERGARLMVCMSVGEESIKRDKALTFDDARSMGSDVALAL